MYSRHPITCLANLRYILDPPAVTSNITPFLVIPDSPVRTFTILLNSRVSTHTCCTVVSLFIFCNTILWNGIVIDVMQFYNLILIVFRYFPFHIQVLKSLRKIYHFCQKVSEQTPLKRFCEIFC